LFTFTPELFLQIYGAEPANSYRQDAGILFLKENMSSLLLPSDSTVSANTSSSTEWEIRSFDEVAGKYTVARRAGLYTDCLYPENADFVTLIHPSGLSRTMIVKFSGAIPRLADVLRRWTHLVESGTWEVDANGVSTSIEWFRANPGEGSLPEQGGMEAMVSRVEQPVEQP
jgi:hypothetical protein